MHQQEHTSLIEQQQHAKHLLEYAHFNDARQLIQQTLQQAEQQHGTATPEYASSLQLMGEWHDSQGEYDAAEPLIKEALNLFQQHFGAEHINTAEAQNSLGKLYTKMARFKEALQLQEQALATHQHLLGQTHLNIARNLNDLGTAYHYLQQTEQALNHYEQAAAMSAELLGMNHHDTALAYTNVASIYRIQGYHEQALSILHHTLDTTKQSLKSDTHPRIPPILRQIAATYEDSHDNEKAESYYQDAINIGKISYGNKHPNYGHCLNAYATFCVKKQRFDEAFRYISQALIIYLDTLGEEHQATKAAMHNTATLAFIRSQNGDTDTLQIEIEEEQ